MLKLTEGVLYFYCDFSSEAGLLCFRKTSAGALPVELFSESSTESEEEEEQPYRHPETDTVLSSEYRQIQKLVEYLKV